MFAALGAAHQIGIIHRDFKSDNVMLVPMPSGQPRAVVMDFGLAQTVTEAPPSEDAKPLVAGTLGYMAPEQLSGGNVTAAADVYAFGVVLHEMLTGVLPPFRPRVARGGTGRPPPPPPLLLDALDIPARWSALIRRCLARDPAARFRNIIEARDALAGTHGKGRRVLVAAAAVAAVAAAMGVVIGRRTPAAAPTATASASAPAPAPAPTPAPAAAPAPAVAALPVEPEAVKRVPPPPAKARTKQRHVVQRQADRQVSPVGLPPTVTDNDDAIDPFRD